MDVVEKPRVKSDINYVGAIFVPIAVPFFCIKFSLLSMKELLLSTILKASKIISDWNLEIWVFFCPIFYSRKAMIYGNVGVQAFNIHRHQHLVFTKLFRQLFQ